LYFLQKTCIIQKIVVILDGCDVLGFGEIEFLTDLGCKHNVKEVPLAWQQLQFFAIYCYLTGSPHDKGN